MASKFQIVHELADEWGKASPDVLARIETKVGEITIDLLSQNDCRFAGLRDSETITVSAGTMAYKLPYNFATLIKEVITVDADGDFLNEFEVVDENEFIRRKTEGGYATTKYGMIEYRKTGTSGPGWYFLLAADWEDTGYIKVPFYREPTEDDTELIRNVTILKAGVRAQFPEFNPKSQNDLVMYEKGKSGFRENPETITTKMAIRPSPQAQRLNKLQWKIGDGY